MIIVSDKIHTKVKCTDALQHYNKNVKEKGNPELKQPFLKPWLTIK